MEILERKYRNQLSNKMSPEHALDTADRVLNRQYEIDDKYKMARDLKELAEVLVQLVRQQAEIDRDFDHIVAARVRDAL